MEEDKSDNIVARDDEVAQDVEDKPPSDEEEGEDVFDSSEEDADLDEDEDEARKIKEGFIVDDEDEDDQVEGGVSKRRRKHKRRQREEEDDRLSEDDLDLLMENAGVRRNQETASSGRLKRLKREGEDETTSEGTQQEVQKTQSATKLDDFFSEDENEEEEHTVDDTRRPDYNNNEEDHENRNRKSGMLDELDDFIEEDEFSDEDEETRQQRLEEKKRMRDQRMKQPTQITGLSSDKIDEMYDIFGDGHDYDWALEIENEELEQGTLDDLDAEEEGEFGEQTGASKAKKKITLQDIYDLQDLKKNLMTEEDMIIRKTDIPERFQEIREGLVNYGELSLEDQELETNWISDKISLDKNFDASYDLTEFKEAVGNSIKFINQDNLEVPFIYAYRRNYIASKDKDGFVLTEDDLWDIVDLDIEFHSIIYKRDYVKRFYKELNVVDSMVDEYFRNQNAASIAELNSLQDIYDYLEFTYAQEINEVLLGNTETNGKKHLKNSSYEKFKASELYNAIKDIGVTAEQVGENIISQHQIHIAVDHPSLKPREVIESILNANSGDLQVFTSNFKLAIDTVQKYFALELSKNTKIREKVRSDFYKYYLADVVLTSKGKREIQRGSLYEDIKYAINRTPMHFRRDPDVFLRMLEAENLNLLSVKLHMSSQAQYIDLSLIHI